MLDLKILHGDVVDGTGSRRRRADVGVRDGRIVAIGQVDEPAREVIDATGQVVSPGFVDVHTHYDVQAFWDPTFSPSCFHGVTTVVGGNCGFSVAPLTPEAGSYLMPMLARVEGMPLDTLKAGAAWDWHSFGDYLGKLEGRVGLNAGFLVGHSAVRRIVMGERANEGPATPDEVQAMQRLVDASLREGALGFSTTVARSHNDAQGRPVPSRWAAREEILALGAVVREHEGTCLELLPNLQFDDATVDLLVDFSLAGNRPVNWNLLIVHGTDEASRAMVERMLSVSDIARQRGAEVVALAPPANPGIRINLLSGFIFDMFPGWNALFRLPVPERMALLRQPAVRAILDAAAAAETTPLRRIAQWETLRIVETHASANRPFQGRTVGEAAAALGKTPFDAFIDLALADDLRTVFLPPLSGEDPATYALRGEVWAHPGVVVGASDAGAHLDMIDSFAFSTVLLQKAREYGVMPLEACVQQLTQVPARLLGLRERGVLREGAWADIAVFDPATVGAGAAYTRYDLPGTQEHGRVYADAVGMAHVVVNGTPVVREGQHTGRLPGTVLRSGRDTRTVLPGS